MEENLKEEVIITEETSSEAQTTVKGINEEERVKFKIHNIIEIALYVIGVILLIVCMVKYGADLNTYGDEYRFIGETYVGGDAYNYIISASRSAAVMVKSLIFAVLGCSSIITGLLVRIASKK